MRLILINLYLVHFVCCTSILRQSYTPLKPSETYTHKDILLEDEPEQYVLFWKVNSNEEIQFEIHAKTLGWVGLGISPNGGMQGADIAFGWFDASSGGAHVQDTWASRNTRPVLDEQQNWNLLDGAEVDGYTILKISRKLYTCDLEKDVQIKTGSTYVIFAWHPEDPTCGETDWKYHGSENRHTKSLLLLNYQTEGIDEQNLIPDKSFVHAMNLQNLKVPPKDTFYYCQIFKLPDVNESVHLIQYEMDINKQNRKYVHHLLGYECDEDYFPMDTKQGYECGYVNLPQEIQYKCHSRLFIAWGVGGNYRYNFPKDTGYPLRPSDKPKYILIEMHYDNPSLIDNIVDNSGIKFVYTASLRKHELGMLTLGADNSLLSIQIPPKLDSLKLTSICYDTCTNQYIPDDGITVLTGFLHTHLSGRSVKTTLIRNDEIIDTLIENPNYDFNYQYSIDIEPTKMYKNDILITECIYETRDRTNMTTFGYATHDEMCLSLLYYYPRIENFKVCLSFPTVPELNALYKTLASENLMEPVQLTSLLDYNKPNEKLLNSVRGIVSSPRSKEIIKEFYEGKYRKNAFCGITGQGMSTSLRQNLTHYTPLKNSIKEDVCMPDEYDNKPCKVITSETTTKTNFAFHVLPSLFLVFLGSVLL